MCKLTVCLWHQTIIVLAIHDIVECDLMYHYSRDLNKIYDALHDSIMLSLAHLEGKNLTTITTLCMIYMIFMQLSI